jgi:hypothetical protein
MGRGVSKVYSDEATATSSPSARIKSALVAVVEESMPIKYVILFLPLVSEKPGFF